MARTQGHGNPPWTRDETILALDLYFRCDGIVPSPSDGRITELSGFLRRMPLHSPDQRRETFRNVASIGFKLQNLRRVATGHGLGNVSTTDRDVWDELGSSPAEVNRLASLIRRGVEQLAPSEVADTVSEDEEFFEGRLLTRIHKERERDRRIRRRVIASRMKGGILECEICGLSSTSFATAFRESVFEVHHIVPVAQLEGRITRLRDVALLCANCHKLTPRAIAQEQRWLSLEEARDVIGCISLP